MMKNQIKANILLLTTLIILLAGCSSKSDQDANFRVGQFFLNSEKATITLYEGTDEVASLQLKYGQLSEYQTIASNIYKIKVWADGNLVLEKKIGMGNSGKYTLVLTGIPEKNQAVNEESFTNSLHNIAEGSEGITSNNFLPQLLIQDDFYIIEMNRANISITNLLPGALNSTVSLIKKDKEVKLDAVAYPQTSDLKVIDTGTYDLQFYIDGNLQATLLGQETIEEDVLYSLYLIPNPEKYITNPELIIGKNKMPK